MEKSIARLDFTVPDFLRKTWASEIAKEYWEPKIHSISDAWPYIERASVIHGMRPGTLQSVVPEDLPKLQTWAVQNQLGFSILGMEGAHQGYGNATQSYVPGQPFTYRVYIGDYPQAFKEAWDKGLNNIIGDTLGYPACCSEFFSKYWIQEGWRDLTLPAIETSEMRNLIYNNVLLKHLGVRPVFHLPCSFSCRFSCQIGVDLYDLMRTINYGNEAEWLRELVSMPMEWSSLHGIAILTTPIFKMTYNTDPLAQKQTLRLLSEHYLEHGASGKQFPFVDSRPIKLLSSFNGFKTMEGMKDAHKFILQALPKELSGRVVDLGCGTGELLREIRKKYPDITCYGVDNQRAVINRAVKQANFDDSFFACDIYEYSWRLYYDLVLIANQRLFERPRTEASELLYQISTNTKYCLIYTYAGWNHGVDDLINDNFKVFTSTNDSVLNYEAILLESKPPELRGVRYRENRPDLAEASPQRLLSAEPEKCDN